MERNYPAKKQRGKGIVKVSDLFKKYTDVLKAPQKTVVKNFIEVVDDLFGIVLRSDQCTFSVTSRTVTLTISGTLKTEILLHKKEILLHMKGRLGEKNSVHEIL